MQFITIIGAYVPTMTSMGKVKEQFWTKLDTLLCTTLATDKLILLGDFKARVGSDNNE